MDSEGNREATLIGHARLRVPKVSWALLTTLMTLATLSAVYVLLTPAGGQTELTGRTWEQFAAQDPEVASLFSMQLTLIGLSGAAFALLAAIVSVVPYRRGDRWAWYALWLVPITYGGGAARMLIDQYAVGFVYAGLAAVAVVGLLIPIRHILESR